MGKKDLEKQDIGKTILEELTGGEPKEKRQKRGIWKILQIPALAILTGLIIGAVLMGLLMWAGFVYPIELPASLGNPFVVWFVVLMLYCLLASVLPIWFMEQPRDYLSALLMVFGILLGFVAIFTANAPMQAPVHVSAFPAQGPIWPMLFIIVACGAVSGFHALVGAGTTVKQLPNEKDGLAISFGSMVLEAAQSPERDVPDYLEVDHGKMTAKLTRIPTLTDVPYPVMMEPNLVIEFYSR